MFLFVQLGFFNEADTLESSSLLIYSDTQHYDTQHNEIQHNDTQHTDTQHNDK
jgi:hypothetical protein